MRPKEGRGKYRPVDGQTSGGFTTPHLESTTEIIVRIIYVRNMVWGRILVTTVTIRGNDTNIFTNVNTAPHFTHDLKVGHEAVSEGNVASLVFIFFGEYTGKFTLPDTCLACTKLVCTA